MYGRFVHVNKKPTKMDVSRIAGVSHMSITRVLRGFPHVSEKVREKVLKACRKLNYRPNLAASSLRGKKSHALGVIVPSFKHAYYARFLSRVEEECQKADYHVIAIQRRHQSSCPRIAWSDIEFLLMRRVDGLLIDSELSLDIMKKLHQEDIPVVLVDMLPKDRRFSFVGTADFKGMRILARYLIDAGHRDIAFLAGPLGHYTSEQRLAGYKKALSENRIPFSEALVRHTDYNLEGGRLAAIELLSEKRSFTAMIGANDYVAIGALSACNQKGIKVPDDISIAGFTGDEIGAYTMPPLTTMEQPIEEIALKATEILFARIKNPRRPTERILLPARLMERRSVK